MPAKPELPKGYKERGAGEMQQLFDEMRDARPTVTRCFLPPCRGGVLHQGPAAEGREAARQHRALKHPDVRVERRHLTQDQQRAVAMAKSEWKRKKFKGEE